LVPNKKAGRLLPDFTRPTELTHYVDTPMWQPG
jgi:hypothetical protein